MRKFIVKIVVFIFLALISFTLILFLLPPTPRAKKSLLFAAIKKDSLLLNEQSPRIIFVGGSNLSFGLNSQLIKDSLKLNPINTAIHASIGIKYMMENTAQYVKKGDIVVLVPEYTHFYREWDYGSEELLRTIFDVNKSKVKLLSSKQIINCIPFVGNLVFSKFDKSEYWNIKRDTVYCVSSFNRYGDAKAHWNMEKQKVEPYAPIDVTQYNPKIIEEIKKMRQEIQEKGALLFVSFPCYQDASYLNSEEAIKKVEKEYISNGFILCGTPERYEMPDSLTFNTPYHLIKAGADYRTVLLIEDMRKIHKLKD